MDSASIVECVPNISEGRDQGIIDQVVAAFGSVEGAKVIDVDPGAATNRTVITIVGPPDAVLEAAFRGIAKASTLIDMRNHEGAHPRMGATDVCPFVPVRGITMEECADLARRLGSRVGEELGIPVFLYEFAASSPERQNLAHVREGEYEGLAARFESGEQPDFGAAKFNPQAGATAISARKFLIAYNVNLNSKARRLATEIAFEIREQGRNQRGPDGKFVRDSQGVPIKRPGRFKNLKAVGWVIEEYQRAQVSMNLTDYEVTGLQTAFDACDEHARTLGARVTGSELVGLVPLEALLIAGRHYLSRCGQSTGVPESAIVQAAIQSLGLSEIVPFDPEEKIIEYRLARGCEGLSDLSVRAFADELSSDSPAPGGGSVAALVGSLGAALSAMVGNLSVGKKGLEKHFEEAERIAVRAQEIKRWFLKAIDDDTDAFNAFMAAFRMKKSTPEEEALRDAAIVSAQWGAIDVPLAVLERCCDLLDIVEPILRIGNPNAASDAACGAACALACAEGAYNNVLTNLGDVDDHDRRSTCLARAETALKEVRKRSQAVHQSFRARFDFVPES